MNKKIYFIFLLLLSFFVFKNVYATDYDSLLIIAKMNYGVKSYYYCDDYVSKNAPTVDEKISYWKNELNNAISKRTSDVLYYNSNLVKGTTDSYIKSCEANVKLWEDGRKKMLIDCMAVYKELNSNDYNVVCKQKYGEYSYYTGTKDGDNVICGCIDGYVFNDNDICENENSLYDKQCKAEYGEYSKHEKMENGVNICGCLNTYYVWNINKTECIYAYDFIVVVDGDLVKVSNSPDVYLINNNTKRQILNSSIYKSWGYPEDYSTVKTITQNQLDYYALGSNLEYNCGSNAYLQDNGECYCNNGFIWNSDKTACIESVVCPTNSNKINNDCICNEGYSLFAGDCITNSQLCEKLFPGSNFEWKGNYNDQGGIVCDCKSGYSVDGDVCKKDNNLIVSTYSNAYKTLQIKNDVKSNYKYPLFKFSGIDNVSGYYVYFGNNSSSDPVKVGKYITKNEFQALTIKNDGDYYLIIKTKTKDGVISDSYVFKYSYNSILTQKEIVILKNKEKISGPSQIKNYTNIEKVGNDLWGNKINNIVSSENLEKSEINSDVKVDDLTSKESVAKSNGKERIPGPSKIKDYINIEKIGINLWGNKK